MNFYSFVIALCLLKEFVWTPRHGLAGKRIAIAVLALLLTGCGKHGSSPGPVCVSLADVQMITYPDGVSRKSNMAQCSDGRFHVSFVNDPNQAFDVYNTYPEGYQPPSE